MIVVYQQDTCDYYDIIADTLEQILLQKTENSGSLSIPEVAFNPLRHQYDALVIIDHITKLPPASSIMKLGIVEKDIYSHGMNYIFGLAEPVNKTALVSTYRLTGEKKQERLAKEVVHEVGHLLGLSHCTNTSCVMCFSNTVEDTDRKQQNLCTTCRSKVEG